MTGVLSVLSLRELVKVVLASDETDTDKLAAALFDMIPEEEHPWALEQALPAFIQQAKAQENRILTHARPTTSSKWGAVARAQASGELELLRWRVTINGTDKFYGDCTADDVLYLERQSEATELQHRNRKLQHRAVRNALKDRGMTQVRDIPEDALRGLWHRER